jgi:cytochrome b561
MTNPRPEPEAPPGVPRWVKVAAIVVGLLILVFLVLQLTGIAGEHGPGMHGSSGPVPVAWTAPVTAHR